MIKNIGTKIFFLCFFLLPQIVFCDDWEFILTKDSLINEFSGGTEYLYANTTIISNGRATYGLWDGERNPAFGFTHHSMRSPYIDGRNAIPANTKDFFGNDLLANRNNILLSYSIDILKSRRRETLLEHEPYYRNHQSYFEDAHMRDIYWYEGYDSDGAGFFAFNAVLFFGARYAECQSLIVNKIEKTEYGYKVRCREATYANPLLVTVMASEWALVQERQSFDLLIYIDGDYIDLYIDNTEYKLGTFVYVSDEFKKQFNNLIKTNICDLTNVKWPQRASGTRDYQLPDNKSTQVKEDTSISVTLNQENTYNDKKEQISMPLWAWLAIIIGLIIMVIGVILYIVRYK